MSVLPFRDHFLNPLVTTLGTYVAAAVSDNWKQTDNGNQQIQYNERGESIAL